MSLREYGWVKRFNTYIEPPDDTGVLLRSGQYLNFGSIFGELGYGIREVGGDIQARSFGGSWTKVGTSGSAANTGNFVARAATTGNIVIATALNSGDILDGVTLADGDIVLVKNQTLSQENGLYVVSATPTRWTDADTAAKIAGKLVIVTEGTTNNDKMFQCFINATQILGTDPCPFIQLNVSGELLIANNLSDVANATTARTNLGLANVDNTSDATKNSAAATFTNKTSVDTKTTLAIVTDATTARTAALTDRNSPIFFTSATATTFTIPTNATVAFPIGSVLLIVQSGTGSVTVAGAVGVTIENTVALAIGTQHGNRTAIKKATDTWYVS